MNNFSNTVEQNMENNCTERIPEISLAETFRNSQEQKKVKVVSISHVVGVSYYGLQWPALWSTPVAFATEDLNPYCHRIPVAFIVGEPIVLLSLNPNRLFCRGHRQLSLLRYQQTHSAMEIILSLSSIP